MANTRQIPEKYKNLAKYVQNPKTPMKDEDWEALDAAIEQNSLYHTFIHEDYGTLWPLQTCLGEIESI